MTVSRARHTGAFTFRGSFVHGWPPASNGLSRPRRHPLQSLSEHRAPLARRSRNLCVRAAAAFLTTGLVFLLLLFVTGDYVLGCAPERLLSFGAMTNCQSLRSTNSSARRNSCCVAPRTVGDPGGRLCVSSMTSARLIPAANAQAMWGARRGNATGAGYHPGYQRGRGPRIARPVAARLIRVRRSGQC